MGDFIKGVVEDNHIGAEYEGKIWSRFLYLRVSDGRVLRIFDSAVISTDLKIGETYELILSAFLVKELRHLKNLPATDETSGWQGRIIDTDWKLSQVTCRVVNPALINVPHPSHVLVSTSVGNLVLYPENFNLPIAAGDFVQWNVTGRFDLDAII